LRRVVVGGGTTEDTEIAECLSREVVSFWM
jgi:hypothetical protein